MNAIRHEVDGDEAGQVWYEGDIFLAADGVEWKLVRYREIRTDVMSWGFERFGRQGRAAMIIPARPLVRVRPVVESHELDFITSYLAGLPTRLRVRTFEKISKAMQAQLEASLQEARRGVAT